MKFSFSKHFATQSIAVFSFFTSSHGAYAHITLDEPTALAGRSYKATFKVGHGCEGSPTTAIRVTLPTGLTGAKPMPKAGWVLSVKTSQLAQPYDNHGRQVTEDVSEITWTAASKDSWLPEAYYDEFVLRGGLPKNIGEQVGDKPAARWFKVLQTCDKGSNDWAQVPASGVDTKGLKSPAALLEIIPSGSAGHQH